MDFDERYRGDMIRTRPSATASDHVAQIVTFSTIKARAAVRDAARVLGLPYIVGDKIAKAMPPLRHGPRHPAGRPAWTRTEGHEDGLRRGRRAARRCTRPTPRPSRSSTWPRASRGCAARTASTPPPWSSPTSPLTEYVPIQRKPDAGSDPDDAPIVTQYEMHGVEELGLLKMDFLGLRNLSVIERALDLIELSTGTRPDIDGVPLDDADDLRHAAPGRLGRGVPARGRGPCGR